MLWLIKSTVARMEYKSFRTTPKTKDAEFKARLERVYSMTFFLKHLQP